jgi:Lon-like protease
VNALGVLVVATGGDCEIVTAVSDEPSQQPAQQPAQEQRREGGLSRRGWTVILSFAVVLVLIAAGGFVRVPYVALGPGPTYDTLGSVEDQPVVAIDGTKTYRTGGELRMTTVSITEDVTLFGALGLWVSGRYALAPREEYIQPGQTEEDLEKENTAMFQDSQSSAETAALRLLDKPVKVIAQEVTREAPADNVIAPGDTLISVNGTEIKVQEDVRKALENTKPGQAVSVTFAHADSPAQTKEITLGKASDYGSDDRKEGFLGIAPVDRAAVDFTTTISLEHVGGPSAGLMFALAIVDRLTPGELQNGEHVAGTGQIDVKGNVYPIGGIEFKLVAAREAGATIFLVPEDNCAEAKADVPDGLRLIKVRTLADARESLEGLAKHRTPPSC